jgi:2,3-dihydroxy-p-cumate/2,3-dihydroxybenzoate 3,4-dioxygenase
MTDTPFRYRRLGYVALNVANLRQSVEFYRDTVGMDMTDYADGKCAFLRCSDDHHDLVLFPGNEPGVKHLGFEMESDADFDTAAKHLRGLGVSFTDTPAAEAALLQQRKSLRFKVPGCGVTFELYTGSVPAKTPYQPKVANILRLGHCVLKINHFDRSFAWLTENFGFKISDHIKGDQGEVAFLRCWPSPYHHSLGIARSDHNQFHHVAFMVGDIDDIGRANNRLPRAGSQVVYGPGRHVASGSIFLYFLDPDGMTLEYTYGMEEFAEHDPRQARKLEPTLDVADSWGGIPSPKSFAVGVIEGSAQQMTAEKESMKTQVF